MRVRRRGALGSSSQPAGGEDVPHVRLHSLVAFAFALVLLGAAGRARAADAPVPRVGIVVTVQVNVSEQESTLLAERLGDALQEKLLVDVISGREVTRR